ncbi:MAG: glucokinase [Pirellulales bacterium]|nr:glucokinase [Pirellulales bacterium]
MILAGDIGGTSTRLALVEAKGGKLNVVVQTKYKSREHQGLDEIVTAFIATHQAAGHREKIEHAAFGIAGPVRGKRVHTPNLPWVVDASQLAAKLQVADVHLLNDLEANASGIPVLESSDFVTLNIGQPDPLGNAAIISAGTGLGEAGINFDGKYLHPFACEGGHSDFAPRDAMESELLLYLREKFRDVSHGHVSYERVLSGPGLVNIYEFLIYSGQGKASPEVAAAMKSGDPAAAISIAAARQSCQICVRAMEIFVSFYGAEAGNLALKIMATRAIYIGGGIAPKIIAKLKEPQFMEAFCAKGRMRPLMAAMPIHVLMNEYTALFGAARYAAQLARLVPEWCG